MSATDNAFIKAYAEELAVALGRPAKRSPRSTSTTDAKTGASENRDGRMSLSGLYREPEVTATAEPYRSRWAPASGPEGACAVPPAIAPDALPPHSTGPASASGRDEVSARHLSGDRSEFPKSASASAEPHLRLDKGAVVPPPPVRSTHQAVVEAASPVFHTSVGAHEQSPEFVISIGGSDTEVPVTPLPGPSFRPQWEVDQLRWPSTVERLLQARGTEWQQAVDQLSAELRPGRNVVAMTSFARGEGRTTLALCVAKLAAQRGLSVALVDGDYDHPDVSRQLGLSVETGWEELPDDRRVLAEAAVLSVTDKLTILPLRQSRTDSMAAGDDGRTGAALETLSASYELVLVDAGPMFAAARTWFNRKAAGWVHGALVVRDARRVTAEQQGDVIERLRSRDIQVIGIAENFGSAVRLGNGLPV